MPIDDVVEEVTKYANPSRRTFLIGLLGAAITAPAVVSFFGGSGQAIGTQTITPNGGLFVWDGPWLNTRYFYSGSANWTLDPSANYLGDISANFPYYSANPIQDLSGNFLDNSANYSTFEHVYYSGGSANFNGVSNLNAVPTEYVVHDITGNAYYEPSGNWVIDPQRQFLYDPSGNWVPLTPDPSANTPNSPTTVPTTQAPTTTTTIATVAEKESSPSATTPKKLPETR
jgi:hypothetical protein